MCPSGFLSKQIKCQVVTPPPLSPSERLRKPASLPSNHASTSTAHFSSFSQACLHLSIVHVRERQWKPQSLSILLLTFLFPHSPLSLFTHSVSRQSVSQSTSTGWTSTLCQALGIWKGKRPHPWGGSGFSGRGHHQPQCHEIWTHRELRSPSVWTDSYTDLDYDDFYYNLSKK